MWNLKKLNSEKQSRVGLPRAWGGLGGEGGEVFVKGYKLIHQMNKFVDLKKSLETVESILLYYIIESWYESTASLFSS